MRSPNAQAYVTTDGMQVAATASGSGTAMRISSIDVS
jgi:hypothetical protein